MNKTETIERMRDRLLLLQDLEENMADHDEYFLSRLEQAYGDLYNALDTERRRNSIRSIKISLRKGAIIVYEDRLIRQVMERTSDVQQYQRILRLVRARYSHNLGNRDSSQFRHLEEVHPEDPCELYEGEARAMRSYREAIEGILTRKDAYQVEVEISESLNTVHTEIRLCQET